MITFNSNNYNNTLPFGVKIPSRDAISLATQRHLSNDFNDILIATDKITERKNNVHDLVTCGNKCRDALFEQFPVLKEVKKNTDKFFKKAGRTDEEIDNFVDTQIKKIGSEEIDVKPIKIEPQVYMKYNSDISREKPVIALIID